MQGAWYGATAYYYLLLLTPDYCLRTYLPLATYILILAVTALLTTCYRTDRSLPPTAYYLPPATYITYHLLPTTCYLPPATCSTKRTRWGATQPVEIGFSLQLSRSHSGPTSEWILYTCILLYVYTCIAVYCMRVAWNFARYILYFVCFTLYFALYTLYFILYASHFTLHTSRFTLHTSHFALHTSHVTSHTLYFVLYTAHCTLCTLNCTLYT